MKRILIELDYTILKHIESQKRIAASDLARDINRKYRTVWQHCKKLEKYGMIKKAGMYDFCIAHSEDKETHGHVTS
jgi:DNA-binding Lrp family transcriptional regulator